MQLAPLVAALLAATSLGPNTEHPFIEVRLRNWENKTNTMVEFCTIRKISPIRSAPEKPPLVQLDPGNKNLDTLIYSQQNVVTSFSKSLRVAASTESPHNYFNLQFMYYDHGAFQIGCVHAHCDHTGEAIVNRLNALLDERIIWERAHPPKYILIEIDGTIVQEDLLNTTFKVEHEMFRLEKIV